MTNAVIATFSSFNERRYSRPWVCAMTATGDHDFSNRVGIYTGDAMHGEEGDSVVFEPVVGQVYGYGQKDYRGNNTERKYAIWDGEKFVPCTKLGKIKV